MTYPHREIFWQTVFINTTEGQLQLSKYPKYADMADEALKLFDERFAEAEKANAQNPESKQHDHVEQKFIDVHISATGRDLEEFKVWHDASVSHSQPAVLALLRAAISRLAVMVS